jgi:hypothetical protein
VGESPNRPHAAGKVVCVGDAAGYRQQQLSLLLVRAAKVAEFIGPTAELSWVSGQRGP